jgi:cell division protease FtsH
MDNFIKSTLHERYKFVKKTLGEYSQAIENMTAVLLDVEVIEGKKVRSIIADYEKENNMESRLAHGEKIAKSEAMAKAQREAFDAQLAEDEAKEKAEANGDDKEV